MIEKKKAFYSGIGLMISFVVVLIILFLPNMFVSKQPLLCSTRYSPRNIIPLKPY